MERNNLWAPWRIKYIQGLSAPSECFLCDYLATPENDKDNLVLWRTKHAFVVFNKFPYNNGHLLIAPNRHMADFDNATDDELLAMNKLVRDCQKVLTETINPHGFNVGMNFGRCAGAGLPDHVHIHVVPRWNGDTNYMHVCSDTDVISQSMTELYDKLLSVSGAASAEGVTMTRPLASFAVMESNTRRRQYFEAPHPYRGPFERDRDRVIHCAAFRRLEGKTQVFTTGLNDHYRTRLTHSIEVAQIGRTIARVLNLNESLTEAICLAHDLGHAPFGHTGEHALDKLMAETGGFEHNRQALRIVDFIEHPYPDFQGLNLMYETRLGLIKHSSPYDAPQEMADWPRQASLEGQIADIADRIAYNCHDLEDGIRSRLLNEDQLDDIVLYGQAGEKIDLTHIDDYVIRRTRIAKTIMDILVSDAIETSKSQIAKAGVETLAQVLDYPERLIAISDRADQSLRQLEAFLLANMYDHDSLKQTAKNIHHWLETLFEYLCGNTDRMPHYYQNMIDTQGCRRTVCDYISGMTDRFCLRLVDEIK